MSSTQSSDVNIIFQQVVLALEKAVTGKSKVQLHEKTKRYVMKMPGAAPDVSTVPP
jgi:hypothetical protein